MPTRARSWQEPELELWACKRRCGHAKEGAIGLIYHIALGVAALGRRSGSRIRPGKKGHGQAILKRMFSRA